MEVVSKDADEIMSVPIIPLRDVETANSIPVSGSNGFVAITLLKANLVFIGFFNLIPLIPPALPKSDFTISA